MKVDICSEYQYCSVKTQHTPNKDEIIVFSKFYVDFNMSIPHEHNSIQHPVPRSTQR